MGGGLRRIALVLVVALPLLLAQGSEPAHASCTYNVGEGDFMIVQFDSHGGVFDPGGYSSSDLGPGQSQCWYAHRWSGGEFGNVFDCELVHNCNDVAVEGIDVDAHGWIDICSAPASNPGASDPWEYWVYDAAGVGVYKSSDPGPGSCTDPTSPSPGASLTRAPRPSQRAGGRARKGADSVFFTRRARSRKVQSITFHVHSAGGKTLGSVCLPPLDVTHLDLKSARRMRIARVYVGIVEHVRRCHHPRVAGPERAGRPRHDVRFASFCQKTRTRVLRTYRYPDDFRRPNPPSCRAKTG